MQPSFAHFDGDLLLANVHIGVALCVICFHAQLTLGLCDEAGDLLEQELAEAVYLHAHQPFVLEVQLDHKYSLITSHASA